MWCPYHPPHMVSKLQHAGASQYGGSGTLRENTVTRHSDGWFGCNYTWYLDMCIVDGYAYSTWIQYNVKVSQSQCNMHTASYTVIDHLKPCVCCQFCRVVHLHILSVLQRTFLYMHQRHLVNLVQTVPNVLHFRREDVKIMLFWLLAHCRSVSLRKWMKRVIVAILFHIYIYQIYASPSVLGSDRDFAVPSWRFFPDTCWSFAGFFGCVLYRLSQRISLNWNF